MTQTPERRNDIWRTVTIMTGMCISCIGFLFGLYVNSLCDNTGVALKKAYANETDIREIKTNMQNISDDLKEIKLLIIKNLATFE